LEEAAMKFISRYSMLIVIVLLLFDTAACEKVDKAFEAVDKAKNLKAEFEKKADEVKKNMSGKDGKSSEGSEKPQKAEKEIRENKGEKD
jgi:Skp family chaperone for outer membrane proteins